MFLLFSVYIRQLVVPSFIFVGGVDFYSCVCSEIYCHCDSVIFFMKVQIILFIYTSLFIFSTFFFLHNIYILFELIFMRHVGIGVPKFST